LSTLIHSNSVAKLHHILPARILISHLFGSPRPSQNRMEDETWRERKFKWLSGRRKKGCEGARERSGENTPSQFWSLIVVVDANRIQGEGYTVNVCCLDVLPECAA